MARTIVSYAQIERTTAKIRKIDDRVSLPIAIPVIMAAYALGAVLVVMFVAWIAGGLLGVSPGNLGWAALLVTALLAGVAASVWKRWELPFHAWAPMVVLAWLRPRHTLGAVEAISAPVDTHARIDVVVRPTHRWPDALAGTLTATSAALVQGRDGLTVDGHKIVVGRGTTEACPVEPGVYSVEVAR